MEDLITKQDLIKDYEKEHNVAEIGGHTEDKVGAGSLEGLGSVGAKVQKIIRGCRS